MMTALPSRLLALIAMISAMPSALGAAEFFFEWPATTSSCQVVNLTWSAGVTPFQAWVVPIYGQPFIYNIPDSAYSNGFGSYPISLQLNTEQNYVVFMSDGNGMGTGGSSEIQSVQPSSNTTCLSSASSNSTSLDFTFTVSGVATQCQRGFEMSWTGGREDGPYNFTVIPLDQSFNPYDVTLENDVPYMSDWKLNMTAGSRFTIVMNSKNGYGRGGGAAVYSVNASDDSSCIDQAPQATGSWPTGVTTFGLSPPTLPVTESARRSHGSSVSGGAIAGIVVGVAAAIALVGLILLLLLRRRNRRRKEEEVRKHFGGVDLGPGDEIDDIGRSISTSQNAGSHMIEPYRPVGSFQPHDGRTSLFEGSDSFYGGDGTGDLSTASSAGFAGMGADTGRSSRTQGSGSASSPLESPVDDSGRAGGPRIAGPLPTKIQTPSTLPTSPPYVDSPSRNTPATDLNHELKRLPDNGVPGRTSSPSYSLTQRESSHTGSAGGPGGGGMRVVNHDNPDSLPALPPGATHGPGGPTGRRRPPQQQDGPTFRRHADAGRVQEEVVDLPPLYSEVPRDGPVPGRGGDERG
ncbi:hypothetical protein IAR55_002461 [Kwoniella newhampshirensis]|uniref:Uncharacterized protein n=1 Tax=Kwoniella newhampshirensis TaxID=1651941 RepID=A0AAW0Z198_9TREE